jgi:hypothetical protein
MKRILSIAAIVLALASISFADTKTDYDHGVNFYKYRTYAWKEPSPDTGIVRNSLVLSRIEGAVNEKLAEKGLRRDDQNPDIYLATHVSARTVQDVNYWPADGWGYGWGWGWGWGPNVTVTPYVEGTIVIDMLDAKTNRLVWRAISTKTGSSLIDVQKEKKVDKMVADAFKHFPPSSES